MFPVDLLQLAEEFLHVCRQKSLTVCTAESCTGGLIAALLTEIPGSSDVLDRGYVTYSNAAKHDDLGISLELIERFGAVSEEVARAMASGALAASAADIAISVTGIAGPAGGSPDKPVGLVHFAYARRGKTALHERHVFAEKGRHAIRMRAVQSAIELAKRQAEA